MADDQTADYTLEQSRHRRAAADIEATGRHRNQRPIRASDTVYSGQLAEMTAASLSANPPKPTAAARARLVLPDVVHALDANPGSKIQQVIAVLHQLDSTATGDSFKRALTSLVRAHRAGVPTHPQVAPRVSTKRGASTPTAKVSSGTQPSSTTPADEASAVTSRNGSRASSSEANPITDAGQIAVDFFRNMK